MYYKELERIIAQKTADLAEPVRDFIDNCVCIYDTGVDDAHDFNCWVAYKKAIEAIDKWMSLVVGADLVEYTENMICASLELPDGKHEYYNELSVSGVVRDGTSLPVVHTPIGDFNYFIYRCIVDIPDNPVMLFYKAMQEQIHRVHVLITLDPDGYNDDLITPAILELCGIHDPLDICRLDSCLTHIDEFFDAHGFHEGWGSV